MNPRVTCQQGKWEPCARPLAGFRKLGVPPGGFWDAAFLRVVEGLGEPCLMGTAAAPGGGPALSLVSRERLAWIVMGSPGALRSGRAKEGLPCLWVGEGTADLTCKAGGRWSIAAFPSTAGPLLRRLAVTNPPVPHEIRVIPLPGCAAHLIGKTWMTSPNSSRVGIRLLGPAPDLGALEASRPSAPGVIQAAGSGELLVHGPDGPTTGGYPQLGAVIKADLGRLSEIPPGTLVEFAGVSQDEAREAWSDRLRQAEQLADTLTMLNRLGLV